MFLESVNFWWLLPFPDVCHRIPIYVFTVTLPSPLPCQWSLCFRLMKIFVITWKPHWKKYEVILTGSRGQNMDISRAATQANQIAFKSVIHIRCPKYIEIYYVVKEITAYYIDVNFIQVNFYHFWNSNQNSHRFNFWNCANWF